MALRGYHPKSGELVQLNIDYLKKETKGKQKAVKLPECDDVKTCAFLSVIFKHLGFKSCTSLYVHPGATYAPEVLRQIYFFQFYHIIKQWHIDLYRLITPVGLMNAYKTHQNFASEEFGNSLAIH